MRRVAPFLALSLGLAVLLPCASQAQRSRRTTRPQPSPPWEVQFGAQIPITPLYDSPTAYAERKGGLTVAVLNYGYMERRVGTRVRLELLIQSARSKTGDNVMKERRTDVGVGLDVVPRALSFAGPGVRGRFYAGFDVVRSSGPETACVTDVELCGGPGALIGNGIHVRGRAGMFLRSSGEQSIVRVDLGYVVNGSSRVTQHDFVFRIGIGS